MKYEVRLSPLAIDDVREIVVYIAEDNPTAAKDVGNAIYSRIEELSNLPKMGALLSSRIPVRTDYRYLVCGKYLVFYRIEGQFVSVYRVLNGMRDYMSILFSDDLSRD